MSNKLRELIVKYNEVNKIEDELCKEIAVEILEKMRNIDENDITEDTLINEIRNNKTYKEFTSIALFYGKEEWYEIHSTILMKIAILKAGGN